MSKTQRNADGQIQDSSNGGASSAETLYQRLGDKWFAFSLIDDEVFVGSISSEELAEATASDTRQIRAYRITGNS